MKRLDFAERRKAQPDQQTADAAADEETDDVESPFSLLLLDRQ